MDNYNLKDSIVKVDVIEYIETFWMKPRVYCKRVLETGVYVQLFYVEHIIICTLVW